MIGKEIAKAVLDKSTELNLTPSGQEENFEPSDSIKSFLTDINQMHAFKFVSKKNFSLEVDIEDYNKALFSDYYYCNLRIKKQIQSIESLVSSSSQIAWILVSVYYCNFFIANELSRLYGKYIVNFSIDDLIFFIRNSDYEDADEMIGNFQQNTSWTVEVKDGEGFNKLLIQFTLGAKRPHEAVWHNMGEIMDKVEVEDDMRQHKRVMKSVFSKSNGWESPSKIRNDWNYKYPSYYSATGNNIGSLFSSNISDREQAYKWGSFLGLSPSLENNCASLAYIYHVLNESNNFISNRLAFRYSETVT